MRWGTITTEPIKPDPQDFMGYCRNHHIEIVQLNASLAIDNRFAAKLQHCDAAIDAAPLRASSDGPWGNMFGCGGYVARAV